MVIYQYLANPTGVDRGCSINTVNINRVCRSVIIQDISKDIGTNRINQPRGRLVVKGWLYIKIDKNKIDRKPENSSTRTA